MMFSNASNLAMKRILFAPQQYMRFASKAPLAISPQECDLMETEYMINTARVKLALPAKGNCWFFIDPELSVAAFKERCSSEDKTIESVEVLSGAKASPAQDQTSLYSLLGDRESPVYLRLNNINFMFDTQRTQLSMEIRETSPWFNHCK